MNFADHPLIVYLYCHMVSAFCGYAGSLPVVWPSDVGCG
jgi:hypothetical protein